MKLVGTRNQPAILPEKVKFTNKKEQKRARKYEFKRVKKGYGSRLKKNDLKVA